MTLSRRSLITGLVSLVAAPAIVRAGSLMPVKIMIEEPLYGTGPMMHALTLIRTGLPQISWRLIHEGVPVQILENSLIDDILRPT